MIRTSVFSNPWNWEDQSLANFIDYYLFKEVRSDNVGTGTDYGVDDPGIESRWGEISHNGPGSHSTSCTKGYQVYFPGGAAAVTWRWSPTQPRAEVKETVEVYLY